MNNKEMTAGGGLRCRICDGAGLMEKPFGYQFNGHWLGAMECPQCGIIFIHPQPTPEEIVMMYSKEYFESGDFSCGHTGSYFDVAASESTTDPPLLHRIRRMRPTGRFLEIGCAGGAFLNSARRMGYETAGVEVSDAAAEFARATFHLNVITGDLFTAKFPAASFDIVYMGDVLEHLPDPGSVVREIDRILAPGGLLVLVCPMQTNTLFSRVGFFVYGLLGRKATVHLPPYHLFEYRRNSMASLVERNGFTVTQVEESLIPPSQVTLRGSAIQRFLKKTLQYPNTLLTKISGRFGDRIEMFASKRS